MREIRARFTDNILDGRYEVYDDKNLIERGKYKNGKKDMLWVGYYKNGKIKSQKFYHNGELDGVFNLYDKNGKIIIRGNFSKNKKIGEWELFRFFYLYKKLKKY